MTRSEILALAGQYVTRDRAAAHGDAERNFQRIAALWSAYLDTPVAPHDVGALMALLKVARIRSNPMQEDSWVDLAGYAACGGEIATEATE